MSIISDMMDAINGQMAEYRAARAADPAAFGHGDGYFDGTPESGPAFLALVYPRDRQFHAHFLWCVHKHEWPLDFWYCIGTASDSRGERTAENLMLDIRDLPKKYIGRLQVGKLGNRQSHRKALERALADGFDLAEHVARINELEREEVAKCVAEKERRKSEGSCVVCGARPVLESGYCTPCDDVPF